ncbi:MAG: major facilitator superfamily domain-containing protein [Linnemannia elongata]|nr:MAG: major facilitator superfamily domain-containing protein [Linnemannia elongata]
MTAFTSPSSSTIHTQAAQPSSQEEEKRRNSSNSLGDTKAEILTTSLHTDPTATLAADPLVDAIIHDKEKEELEMKGLGNNVENEAVTSGSSPITATPRPKPGFWKQHLSIRPEFHGDPRVELSRFRKAVILCVISQAGSLGGFSSTIYFPSLVQITADLNASQTAINASVSLFILFMGISPLVSSTLSDTFLIRRVLYIGFTLIFALASLGGGYANSAGSLIAARVFQAVGSGGASILGAGTVADIYPPEEQGTSMGLMFLGQFLGPVLGPPLGGILAKTFGWQSTFFFMAIIAVIVIVELFFLLPETYRAPDRDLLKEMEEVKGYAAEGDVKNASATRRTGGAFNPFQAIMLLKHPVVLLSSIELGIIFALMFSIETLAPVLFTNSYGLAEDQVGLTYLGAGGGSILGAILGGKLSDLALMRAKAKNGGEIILEDRLSISMWIAGFLIVPFGSLLFGFGAEKHLSIAAPIVGFGIYNFGMAQVIAAGAAYLVNAIPGQGSSATAAANFLRMVMACIFSLIAQIIVDHVGYGNYGIIQAVINIVCMGLFFIVKLRGAGMRETATRKEEVSRK